MSSEEHLSCKSMPSEMSLKDDLLLTLEERKALTRELKSITAELQREVQKLARLAKPSKTPFLLCTCPKCKS